MTSRTRIAAFWLVAVLCGVIAVTYAIRAKRQAYAVAAAPSGVVADDKALKALRAMPHVLFRSTRLGEGYGRLVAVSRDEPLGPRYQTALTCDRLDMAGGVGVCLIADRGVRTSFSAVIFNRDFEQMHTVKLSGIPSRVRVSPNGNLAGITVFVSGHSYAQGAFSTQTTLVDTRTGDTLADLESFRIAKDGVPFNRVDFNFWGVTFARDSTTFYATVATGGETYLVQGDAAGRRGVVIGQGVECPALSPDNTRIAFKKRLIVNGRLIWRLAILELATGAEWLVEGEPRSVDDQVQWLDDSRILYSVSDERQGRSGTSIWMADVMGAAASLWSDGAYSPAVVVP